MIAFDPLLAAPDFKILEVIFGVVVFVIWLVNQALGANKQKPPARRNPNAPPQVNPKDEAAPGQEALADEIEEFLKRAAERRKEKGRGDPRPATAKPVAVKVKKTRRLQDSSAQNMAVPVPPPTGDGVAAHVQEHLATTEFAVRAAHMVDDLARADVDREQRQRKMFSHQLGKLSTASAPSPDQAAPPATTAAPSAAAAPPPQIALASWFANPQNVRQAIIMQEILTRKSES